MIPNAQVGVPVPRSYTMTNNFGTFTGRAVGSALGSARRGVFTIANHELQDYTTTIPAGTTSFRATIGSPSDPAADLDLFVYRAAMRAARRARRSAGRADGDSEESVTMRTRRPARRQVDVDGFAVPAGSTTYDYVDVFANPALGSVTVTDADAQRNPGATWTAPGSVLVSQVPEAGRVMLGNVRVVTNAGVQVGSADVVVEHVSP